MRERIALGLGRRDELHGLFRNRVRSKARPDDGVAPQPTAQAIQEGRKATGVVAGAVGEKFLLRPE